jgi:ATP-dependent DNA ligase
VPLPRQSREVAQAVRTFKVGPLTGDDRVAFPMVRSFADGYIEPCIPTLATNPPGGPDWVPEIRHDGYRLIARRDGQAVRLFIRRGYDWTDRYPAIASIAARFRGESFIIDGGPRFARLMG